MINEPASLSIATLAARVDACELCATPEQTLRAAITVRHARGGAVSFGACERCARAMRRVTAAASGASGPAVIVVAPAHVRQLPDASPELVGRPILVLEFPEFFIGADGQAYIARVWGQGRSDATWIAWIAFVEPGAQLVRVTPPETSQSSLAELRLWASGLEATYIDGAFARAELR